MGKLVVFLPDGRNVDVKLDRERVTIGRRPDNDLCLPYPAVSGEHAAVVTILADSFLEDVGSTNGTLVNGQPVAKHFLRDRDRIDIGKQKIIYVADDSVKLDPDPPDVARVDVRMLAERVDAARARAALQAAGQERPAASPPSIPRSPRSTPSWRRCRSRRASTRCVDAPGPGLLGGGAAATATGRGGDGAGGAGGAGAGAGRHAPGASVAARAQRTRRRARTRALQGRGDDRPPGSRRRRDPAHPGRTGAGAGRRRRRRPSTAWSPRPRASRSRRATGSRSAASRSRSSRQRSAATDAQRHPDARRQPRPVERRARSGARGDRSSPTLRSG